MKVNIYYGGRGVLDDPTQYVIQKMEKVLTELRVEVHRYNIYENKSMIATLPQTLKDVDGIVLATTVEWLGIGGYMNEFLDAMWLYGDKERISQIYMQPVVMSTTYGEREGLLTLENAWEILGGLPCAGLCGYVDDLVAFEMNKEYAHIIEKKAENLYRTISQKSKGLPTSNQAVTRTVLRTQQLELTPQESEQLSQYASDDNYVKKQKQDIEELSSMYRGLMGREVGDQSTEYIMELQSHFISQKDFHGRYSFMITGKKKPLILDVNNDEIVCKYSQEEDIDVYIKIPAEIMTQYVNGQITIQRAFSVGDITVRGDFKTLRKLDEMFSFTA
ncbi:MAG: SCP2 sterol-binding domain-containing protein [Lachnospiraceae bacterium]|jgi:multimeric flavodoxin WrbA|nr:SCP2 sterol-binding domain-containing protein [Lachnospiraceae bacterium]